MVNGLFHLSNAQDILELGFGADEVLSAGSTQTLQDVSSLVLPTNFDQPSRRFREEPHSSEENDQKDNLECNWEPPSESRLSVVNERQTTAEG